MNFFRYLWLACSGFRTYTAFLNLPLRSTLAYWTIFAVLLGIVAMADIIHWFKMGYPMIVQEVSLYLPEFSITNGQAFSTLPQPYFANTNQFPIILDLENSVKMPKTMFPTGVVLHKHELQFWGKRLQPLVMPWKKFPNGTVNREYLKKLGEEMVHTLPFFYFPLCLIILLLGLIQAFLFTLLVSFLERSMNPRFTFSQLFNIALFAITPGAIIIATYISAGFREIRHDLLYFACYCLFLVMASSACRPSLSSPRNQENSES